MPSSELTEVSNTDLQLFRRLANSEIVDVDVAEGVRVEKKPDGMAAAAKAAVEAETQKREPPKEEPQETRSDSERKRDDAIEKQGFLLELQRLEAQGVKLTRRFTLSDSLDEIEYEVAQHHANQSAANMVAFMRDSMRLMLTGIEVGNARFGPFLHLDGWAASVSQDMHRYDNALERIHKRYFRRHQLSPIAELGMLLVGNLFVWHFKSKVFGFAQSSAAEPPRRPPPAQARARPQQAEPEKTQGEKRRRPVLRGPSS